MSATRPIKIIGPLTRVMKRNNGNSKVNIIFSLFPEKEPTCRFCPFAAHRLWNAVKETSSGITAWQYFFSLLATTLSCPVSALPEKHWCIGACFAEECEGVIRGILRTTISLCWPWMSVIDVKCDRETQQGLLYIWFYWPPCRAVCSLWWKDLQC